MKLFFIFTLSAIAFSNAFAQVKSISPLSCFTWGPDQFQDYETVRRASMSQPYEGYIAFQAPSAASYESFGTTRGVYAWQADNVPYHYINNVQVLRWNITNNEPPYTITVTNIFDEQLYTVSTKNSCGIIIFPDSLKNSEERYFVKIRPEDYRSQLDVINFSHIQLIPRKEEERIALLNELKSCADLECKIKILKAHKARFDIISLLELEKLKDPTNKNIDKLYWETVSLIRYEFAGTSWER